MGLWKQPGYLRALPALAAAGLLIGADSPTGGEPGVYAFALSNIYIASSGEAGACPQMADGGLERYFKLLPPAEQAKYADPANPALIEQAKRGDLETAMNEHYGFRRVSLRGGNPGGLVSQAKFPAGFDPETTPSPEQALAIGAMNGFPKDRGRLAFSNLTVAYSSCTNPEDFPELAEGFATYQGKVAPGINLDGKTGGDSFAGLAGEKGVDNQLWRAVGCVKPFREYGERKIAKNIFISARAPTIIELRDVSNPQNDSSVVVNVYGAVDPVTRDGRGEALARASFALDPDMALRATTKGRIKNGVLTTDPVDLRFNYKEQIVDAPREFRHARIVARLLPDGSIEGSVYGYHTLASYWRSVEQMTQNGANLTEVSCAGVKRAIEQFADGDKDPVSGRFTSISAAFDFFGVRAFVVRPEQQGVAQ